MLCLFWTTLLTPHTLRNNERLRQCHPDAGAVLPWINACLPILLISLFALVHDNSNIFYMNATNVGYRVTEACAVCHSLKYRFIQGRRGPPGPSEHSYRPKRYQICNPRGHIQIL